MKLTVEVSTARVDPERYLRALETEAWNACVMRAQGLRERVVLERVTQGDGRIHKRLHVVPDLPLHVVPETYRAQLDHRGLWYDEVTLFDPRSRETHVRIESPAGSRLSATGIARLHERSDGVLLCFDGEIVVELAGLGGLLEKRIGAEVARRYQELGVLLQGFLDRGGDL